MGSKALDVAEHDRQLLLLPARRDHVGIRHDSLYDRRRKIRFKGTPQCFLVLFFCEVVISNDGEHAEYNNEDRPEDIDDDARRKEQSAGNRKIPEQESYRDQGKRAGGYLQSHKIEDNENEQLDSDHRQTRDLIQELLGNDAVDDVCMETTEREIVVGRNRPNICRTCRHFRNDNDLPL